MPLENSSLAPTDTQIREQCARILASEVFLRSKRLSKFLNYVVDETLEGRAEKLKEFTIAIDVFLRDDSFDPSTDSIVRGEAIRLRTKLREYYNGEEPGDLVLIEIPKGHYIPVFRIIDRDALKKEKGVKSSRSIINITGRKLNFTVIGLMVASILYLGIDNYVLKKTPLVPIENINDKSIAVLPFVPLSSGEDDGYFADGLTEEILNSLSQLPEL